MARNDPAATKYVDHFLTMALPDRSSDQSSQPVSPFPSIFLFCPPLKARHIAFNRHVPQPPQPPQPQPELR